MEQLDLEAVGRIARNEARMLSASEWCTGDWPDVSGPLSERYVERFLDDPEWFVGPIAENALEAADRMWGDLVEGGSNRWSDEFVVGHALAVAARNHALSDVRLVQEDFGARALEPGLRAPLDRMGLVDAARLEGVDMRRPVRSAQTCTPQDVADRAAEFDVEEEFGVEGYVSALDVLGPRDYEEIAEGFMESLGGLELDYADLEDIDYRIRDAVEERVSRKRDSVSRGR